MYVSDYIDSNRLVFSVESPGSDRGVNLAGLGGRTPLTFTCVMRVSK